MHDNFQQTLETMLLTSIPYQSENKFFDLAIAYPLKYIALAVYKGKDVLILATNWSWQVCFYIAACVSIQVGV